MEDKALELARRMFVFSSLTGLAYVDLRNLNYDAKLPRVCTRGNTTVINATERYVFEIPDPTPTEERKTLWRMLGF